jgi:Flp pilus assembly protein TadG
MRRITHHITRFRRDERGVFAVVFGVMAIVLVAMAGAVVDFVSLQQSRTTTQVALDAAALALQPEIFGDYDEEDIRQRAEALVRERLGASGRQDITADVDNIEINVDNGSLLLEARVVTPTIFVSLVGVQQMEGRIVSQATRLRLALEVAMVLDNSGSMQQSQRMTNLKSAATCATNILFFEDVNAQCNPVSGATQREDTRIALVPFTMYVNVGAQNATAAWIDQAGLSPLADDNFDRDVNSPAVTNGRVNRLALFNEITNDSWRGCVEARAHVSTGGPGRFYDTDDTLPNLGDPQSLFVPLFAPDLSELTATINSSYNNYTSDSPLSCDRPAGSCSFVERRTGCNAAGNNSACTNSTTVNRSTPSGVQNTFVRVGGRQVWVGAHAPGCNCRNPSYTQWAQVGTSGSGSNNRVFERTGTCTNTGYIPTDLTAREYQERMCKYSGNIVHTTGQKGPNADCPFRPVLPLSSNPASVRAGIAAMVADGGTNIHEGAAWGYRILSPGEPFTEGGPFDEATSKVMILMTDGENTAYQTNNLNGSHYHSAYGFPYNQRLGTLSSNNAALVAEMNQRLLQTCTNAKDAGITIYTIGLATSTVTQSTPQVVRQMLRDCASSPDNAYFPEAASELNDVFRTIASQLAQLRLAL